MNERRIARIEQQIKQRIATALQHEIADPRMGFVTISRVQVDKEMETCQVFWSVIGDEAARRRTAEALDHAKGFLRREVARSLHTRTVPELRFRFDESVAGAQRMQDLLDDLAREREQRDDQPADLSGEAGADA